MPSLPLYSAKEITAITSPLDYQNTDLNSNASMILTDFNNQLPLTVSDNLLGNEVADLMQKEHVRLKLVVNKDDEFIGIVTLNSLNNQEIVKRVASGFNRNDLTVTEFMVPKGKLMVLDLSEVHQSSIKDVIYSLKDLQEQHVLVMDDRDKHLVGLISTTDIIKRLRIPMNVTAFNTFHDIYLLLKQAKKL